MTIIREGNKGDTKSVPVTYTVRYYTLTLTKKKKKKHSFFTSCTNPLFKYGVADYVTHTAALYLVDLYYYIGKTNNIK